MSWGPFLIGVAATLALIALAQGFRLLARHRRRLQLPRSTRAAEARLPRQWLGESEGAQLAPSNDVRRSGPVRFAEISLENVRCFEELSFPPFKTEDEGESGQWVLLLGDNGTGKSAILRALVLAMSEPSSASALLQAHKEPAPLVQLGKPAARIRVRLANRYGYHVEVRPGPVAEELISLGDRSFFPAVFAYGAQRGSALGRSSRHVSFSPLGSVETLFDESAELIHSRTWLMQVRLAAVESRGGAAEAFYDAVCAILVELLPGVERVDCDAEGVWVSGDEVGRRVPLAALSDGYLTTTGWVLDLIARWANRLEQLEGRRPDGKIARKMNGLVLIDEIDLHLHPRWQVDVVSKLRETFPRLSFVASTHNPLTLLGARPGEVHILRRDFETQRLSIEQRDVPPGLGTDQILTGQWFGLSTTLDQETLGLLEDHRRLLRQGVERSHPRRLHLERELRRRLGTFADTSVDRMALDVAAEVMEEADGAPEQLSPDERQAVRGKILSRVESKTRRLG